MKKQQIILSLVRKESLILLFSIWVIAGSISPFYGIEQNPDGKTRPNLLIIHTDEQTFRSISCYKNSWPDLHTPHIDMHAKKVARFDKFYANNPDEKSFTTDFLTDRTIEFIEKNKDNDWCYMVSIPDPHDPNTERSPYDTMYKPEEMKIPPTFHLTEGPNTIWGAGYNKWDTSGTPPSEFLLQYKASARIPFVLHYPPKIKPNTVVSQVVSNIDFVPTILDLILSPISMNADTTCTGSLENRKFRMPEKGKYTGNPS